MSNDPRKDDEDLMREYFRMRQQADTIMLVGYLGVMIFLLVMIFMVTRT